MTEALASRGEPEWDRWWSVARATVGVGMKLVFRLRFSGTEHLPGRGGALLCYNHVSVLDPLVVAVAVTDQGRTPRFMALTDDFNRPVVGWILRRLGQIPVRRGAGDWAAIERVANEIKQGSIAGLSPEGTVGDGACLLPGQRGAARIALAAERPIIPVGIWGTQQRWPRAGLRLARPVRANVAVVFGPPIQARGDYRSRPVVRALTDRIMEGIGEAVTHARAMEAASSSGGSISTGRVHR